MATIAARIDPTLAAVDAAVEQLAAAELPRPYLGASSIGTECERQLWYRFRWCASEQFTAPTLYRFEDGHRTEDLRAARLRLVPGIELHTVYPGTDRQIPVVFHAGHFRGHLDGAIRGLLQAPKTWHVWEGKCVNEKSQEKLAQLVAVDEKGALQAWNAVYFAQAQVYMHGTGMTRHYLTADSPGGRTCVGVRTDYQPKVAAEILAKAGRIIFSGEPRPKLTNDPAFYLCKWCPASELCHGKKLPPVNCRTCAHATPEPDGDGRWTCAQRRMDLSIEMQRTGCEQHRYIPALVTWGRVSDADPDQNWIEYQTESGATVRNGDLHLGMHSSEELRLLDPAALKPAEEKTTTITAPSWMQPGPKFGKAA